MHVVHVQRPTGQGDKHGLTHCLGSCLPTCAALNQAYAAASALMEGHLFLICAKVSWSPGPEIYTIKIIKDQRSSYDLAIALRPIVIRGGRKERGRTRRQDNDKVRDSEEGTRDSGVMKEILWMSMLGASFSDW